MQIKSSLLPPERGVILIALETLADDKRLFVGLGQGSIAGGEVTLSDTGERCYARLQAHSRAQRPDGAVHIVPIDRFARTRRLIREAFTAAEDGDMVFIVCADGSIYDAAFAQLNIEMRPGLMATH